MSLRVMNDNRWADLKAGYDIVKEMNTSITPDEFFEALTHSYVAEKILSQIKFNRNNR